MSRSIAFVVLIASVGLAAQQAPVFRTSVQFVTVDVVVTDSDDRPVRNLTQDDFEVFDRGRLQRVSEFRFVDIPRATTTLADVKAMPPASDVVSNAITSPDSRVFVVIVDTLHTLQSEMVPTKQVLQNFIQSISPNDEVAIVYPTRSDLGTNFTSDRRRMLSAVDDVRAAYALIPVDALGRTTRATQGPSEADNAGRALVFSLKQAARALAGSVHPRRAIVLVGAGSPANMTGDNESRVMLFDEFKETYRIAREANVPIYTLDPRGMVVLSDAIGPGNPGTPIPGFNLRYQKENLHVAAINTGGRAFVDQSNITRAMEALVEENGAFYLLGYYPDTAPRTERFNEIELKVKRPGLKVRARRGYHATGSTLETTAPLQVRLQSSMRSALDVRGLTLRASVSPLVPTDKATRTAVTVHVTYPMQVAPDVEFDDLRLHLLALDGDAKVKAEVERAYRVRAPRSDRSEVAVVINDTIDLPPQEVTLRIGVASQALGRSGTVQMQVQPLRPSESRIQLGRIVLGTPDTQGPPALGADFIKALVPFQPTTDRTFRQEQTLRVFAPVFWKGRETETRFVLTVTGEGGPINREERVSVPTPIEGRRLTFLDTTIPLSKLRGPVTLRLDASVKDGQLATQQVRFTVLDPR